jgi:hypothetical protein
MAKQGKDQKPSREEDEQHEHAEQGPGASTQPKTGSEDSGGRSGLGPDEAQRRQRDSIVTERPGDADADASQTETASPSDEPVPSVRRGALNTQYDTRSTGGAAGESQRGERRSSVESPIDPDSTSPQGGAGTDTLTPGGRRNG